MAAVLSPNVRLSNWQPLSSQTASQSWQPQIPHYQQQTSIAEYSQPVLAPSVVVQAQQTPAIASHSSQSRRLSTSRLSSAAEGPWTAEMDNVLIDAQARGLRWEQISQDFFPGKSANACRKRFGRAKEERRASDWDDGRISHIIHAYNKEGIREQMWSVMARETGERWQDIERWCFSQGFVKITRARHSHFRNRSRSSRQSMSHARDDSRYNSSSNDEYEATDEQAIGLGLRSTPVYHPAPMGPMGLSSGPNSHDSLLHPPHRFAYGP